MAAVLCGAGLAGHAILRKVATKKKNSSGVGAGSRSVRVWSQQTEGQQPASPAVESAAQPQAAAPAEAPSPADVVAAAAAAARAKQQQKGQALQSGDWVATQLTRRFGLVGGAAWFGLLAFGVISEQIKTRRELAEEKEGTKEVSGEEVVTPDGLRYRDLKVGGGSTPQRGFLIVLDYKAFADGQLFEDTKERGKPIVFLYGKRPFTGGLCEGVERALATMRAGGKRVVTIPPELGFGSSGTVLRPTLHVPEKAGIVPPNATLQYELSLVQVSIPPS